MGERQAAEADFQEAVEVAGDDEETSHERAIIERAKADSGTPAITDLKQEVREMRREAIEGNLYNVHKATRKRPKDMDDSMRELFHPGLVAHQNVKVAKFNKRKQIRGLEPGEKAIPVSPRIGPYEVKHPIYGSKNYFWCSCGLSSKQPFCDRSHVGTEFNPLKFSLDEACESMWMCGCKKSTNAPFCDGDTCKRLLLDQSLKGAGRRYQYIPEQEGVIYAGEESTGSPGESQQSSSNGQ